MSTTDRVTDPGPLVLAVSAALLAVGTYAVMTASLRLLRIQGFGSPVWWPVVAVAVVVLVRCPRRWWVALLAAFTAGSIAASVTMASWSVTITYIVVNLVEVLIAALVLTGARAPGRRWLWAPLEAARFVIAALLSVGFGAILIMISAVIFPADAPMYDLLGGYVIPHLLGLGSLAALLLPGRLAWRVRGWAIGELALALATFVVFASWSFLTNSTSAYAFPSLLVVIWIAIRFGTVWTTVACLLTIIAAAYGAAHDRGAFAAIADLGDRQWTMQLFIATTAAIALALVLITRHRAGLVEQVRDSEATLRSAIGHALVGMYTIRLDGEHFGEIVDANSAICELLGYRQAELVGKHCRIVGYGSDALHTADPAELAAFDRHLAGLALGTQPSFRVETDMYTKDGARLWAEIAVTRVDPQWLPPFALIHVHDLTSRREHNRKLEQMALHDALTGLANRVLLFRRIEQALGGAALASAGGGERNRDRIGVLYVDLDDFKSVNDTYGHAAGDAVLIDVARRLTTTVRPGDTVARLGGDEFAIFCSPIVDDAELAGIEARVRKSLRAPCQLPRGIAIPIRASIGAATSEITGTADQLIREADAAMYREKAQSAARLAAAFEK